MGHHRSGPGRGHASDRRRSGHDHFRRHPQGLARTPSLPVSAPDTASSRRRANSSSSSRSKLLVAERKRPSRRSLLLLRLLPSASSVSDGRIRAARHCARPRQQVAALQARLTSSKLMVPTVVQFQSRSGPSWMTRLSGDADVDLARRCLPSAVDDRLGGLLDGAVAEGDVRCPAGLRRLRAGDGFVAAMAAARIGVRSPMGVTASMIASG